MQEKKTENLQKFYKEVRAILQPEPTIEKTKEKPVIFDGRQYSVRIPKKFADATKLQQKKDKIKFTLKIPQNKTETPKLTMELVKND